VYSYVYWRLAPAHDAVEDLVQDVFLEAWRNLQRYRGDGGLAAWLVGIARHKVQDHYRRALRNVEFPEDTDTALSELPLLEDRFFAQQRDDRIHATITELPEIYRFVLLWRYWEGKSATEIAWSIGRTEKAVERLLARARQQFRERYRE
jgi:RNA polymerase sigma factor (sigma-70 family)